MLRVFDGKIETEEEDSETEHIFEMGGNLSGKGAGKVGCFVSLLYMFANPCRIEITMHLYMYLGNLL